MCLSGDHDPVDIDLHETCFKCHGDQDCDECHGRDPNDLFDHASTGWPLRGYHGGLHCRDCHGHYGAFLKLEPRCSICHPDGFDPRRFDHATTGLALDEVHIDADCADCHVKNGYDTTDCTTCHDEGWRYEKGTGFGS